MYDIRKVVDYFRNTVNKKAVAIIGDSIMNGIDQYGLSN